MVGYPSDYGGLCASELARQFRQRLLSSVAFWLEGESDTFDRFCGQSAAANLTIQFCYSAYESIRQFLFKERQ